MKAHRIFNKGEFVYALLSSYTKPNVLIPVRGIIIDTQWDPVNPLYKIKILRLYDKIPFLKKFFIDMYFKRDFEKRAKRMPLKTEDIVNLDGLVERFNQKDANKFYVVVESVMCKKTREDLRELFNSVQFYIISKNLKSVRENLSRSFYKGIMSIDSEKEFDARFIKSWDDKFKNTKIDINKYLLSLK